MTEIKIDYHNSILSVSNSILKYFNGVSRYETLPELDAVLQKNYKNIVFMIIDCMGTSILKNNLPQDSFLNRHILKNISSVFPPTTTAATTTFHSGLPPVNSGWIGWMCYFSQYDKIIELFRNTEFYSGKPAVDCVPNECVKYETIYSQITRTQRDVEYDKIFPPFDPDGVQSFKEMCDRIVQVTKKNSSRKIISAYWNEPDHSIHQYGTQSPEIKAIMEDIEQNIVDMNEKLEDTLIIISADHGAVNIEEIYLNSYPNICETFIRPPALEARFVTFFIKPNQHGVFKNLFDQYFGNDFVLFTRDDFLSSGILGPGKMHACVPSMIGDFVAIGVRDKSLRYSTGERVFSSFKADHAGYTKDEMTVPLIVLEAK
ncbi:MAG: alkaline phosphatase family protein [Alphaproteobacteria bacterium]|nr:alkaline phosphatase family protein [Alphaproteobacteria bacterium]